MSKERDELVGTLAKKIEDEYRERYDAGETIKLKSHMPRVFAEIALKEFLDAIERGEVAHVMMTWKQGDEYETPTIVLNDEFQKGRKG